ncbi:MAG TPA: hypothetical protein PK239_10470 [Chitinophagales bacterium]|nr:hypothetical protein [Chitinophagales bacterium]
MEIKSQYLQKYLHSIAIEQIAEEYRQNMPYTYPDGHNTIDKPQYCEVFPFGFEITLKFDETKHHLIISEVGKLQIDTMFYYEETA